MDELLDLNAQSRKAVTNSFQQVQAVKKFVAAKNPKVDRPRRGNYNANLGRYQIKSGRRTVDILPELSGNFQSPGARIGYDRTDSYYYN